MLDNLYYLFECIALVTALVQYTRIKTSVYKFFVPYLLFIVAYETASLYDLFIIHRSNAWITNIEITIEFLFYSFFITSFLTPQLKKRLRFVVLLVLAFTIADILWIGNFWTLSTPAIILQYIVMIIVICCFFYELLYNSHEMLNILRLSDFWVNTGLLFFCLAEFLFFVSFAYMSYKHNYHYYVLFLYISNLANILLYSCLAIAFLCFRPTKKLL